MNLYNLVIVLSAVMNLHLVIVLSTVLNMCLAIVLSAVKNLYFILYSENQCISKLDKIGIFIDMKFH